VRGAPPFFSPEALGECRSSSGWLLIGGKINGMATAPGPVSRITNFIKI
jgi:hypothetical protein